MKKISLLLILLILVLSACDSSSDGRERSASQPGGAQEIFLPYIAKGTGGKVIFPDFPDNADQFAVGIQTKAFEPAQSTYFSASSYFPVNEIIHTDDSLDRLILDLDSTDSILFALGHGVANMEAVEPLGETIGSINWVIFYPGDSPQTITEWVQYKHETKDDGSQETLAIEFPVGDAISFAADEMLEAQVESLIAARNERYDPETKAGTFVDMVLVQVTDSQGIKRWILYSFRPGSDAPGIPGDSDVRFCCQWLNCAYATYGYWARVCTFWDCVGRCGP